MKVGSNEPCPCGSGKKYKECCGGNPVTNFTPVPKALMEPIASRAGDTPQWLKNLIEATIKHTFDDEAGIALPTPNWVCLFAVNFVRLWRFSLYGYLINIRFGQGLCSEARGGLDTELVFCGRENANTTLGSKLNLVKLLILLAMPWIEDQI